MTEALLEYEAQYRVSRAIACHWGPAWLDSTPTESPQPQETSAVTAKSADVDGQFSTTTGLADQDSDNPFVPTPEVAAYSEACWAEVYPHDYRYLTAPRNYPSPCPWCGGRLRHNRLCDELRRSWVPSMPFGKYKNKPLSAVPRDYLQWFATIVEGELCDAIQLHLETDQQP